MTAPRSSTAEPALASAAHAQHGTYLDMVSRDEWNPSDFAFHLSRRARGLPLWFSLATYGTDAYTEAVETTLDVARRFAAEVDRRDGFGLVLDPQLSVVLFTVDGWDEARYRAWSQARAREGVALIVPTWWQGECCYRICVVNPLTTAEMLSASKATYWLNRWQHRHVLLFCTSPKSCPSHFPALRVT